MVPCFWGQGSVGPIEVSVLNLYKFQRPRGCYYSASQGCPPSIQCHLTHGGLREAQGLERGGSQPKVTQPVHGDQKPEVCVQKM